MKLSTIKLTQHFGRLRLFPVRPFVAFLLVSSIFSLSSVFAATGVPEIINFQGRLIDASTGDLLGGEAGTNFCYRFSIWDDPDEGEGAQIWPAGTPATMTILTRDGVFDAAIGGAGGDTLDYNFDDNDTVYV